MEAFDSLFYKVYDYDSYNCSHFLIDCWKVLFNVDLSFMLPSALNGNRLHKINDIKSFKNFKLVKKPTKDCVILARMKGTDESHFATFYKGKILQINLDGVSYLPPEVAFLHLKDIRYYEYRLHH